MASKRKVVPAEPPPREPPSKVAAFLSVFEAASIKVEQGADLTYPWTVGENFLFWPANGMWRSKDGRHTGYTAPNLVRAIREGVTIDDHPTLGERRQQFRDKFEGETLVAVERALAPERMTDCQDEYPADVEPPR